jgi:hypothetical protein
VAAPLTVAELDAHAERLEELSIPSFDELHLEELLKFDSSCDDSGGAGGARAKKSAAASWQ